VLPVVEQPADMALLDGGELELRDDTPGLRRVVILDRGLEALAERLRLTKLPA
jgi:hypothetical protein